MKKSILVLTAIAALTFFGCNEKPKSQEHPVSQVTNAAPAAPAAQGSEISPHQQGIASQAPENAVREPHRGRVVSMVNGAGYTYLEVEEKGKRFWAAVMQTKVKQGDLVEIPDIPPMENFYSKSLNRTFEKIIFSPILAVNGKMRTAVAQPGMAPSTDPHAGLRVEENPGETAPAPSGNMMSANPHGTLMPQASGPGPVHKGKVIETMNAAGYTYVEIDENGTKLWAAVMETKVKAGDDVEFPDAPPMHNFHSNSLNRTFERIIFSPAIRINGKQGNA